VKARPAAGVRRQSAYRFDFSVDAIMRFTNDGDIRNMRAMAARFSPAPNEALIRFAFPSGISSTLLAFLRDCADWNVAVPSALELPLMEVP
jgi:hypothetical protein